MAEQEKSKAERAADHVEETTEPAGSGGRAQETIDEIDDLLEEIDSVLEENAEEFVKNYVQKGGE